MVFYSSFQISDVIVIQLFRRSWWIATQTDWFFCCLFIVCCCSHWVGGEVVGSSFYGVFLCSFWFNNPLAEEEIAGCFTLVVLWLSLLRGAMGWSVVCDCSTCNSWTYWLAFWQWLKIHYNYIVFHMKVNRFVDTKYLNNVKLVHI